MKSIESDQISSLMEEEDEFGSLIGTIVPEEANQKKTNVKSIESPKEFKIPPIVLLCKERWEEFLVLTKQNDTKRSKNTRNGIRIQIATSDDF